MRRLPRILAAFCQENTRYCFKILIQCDAVIIIVTCFKISFLQVRKFLDGLHTRSTCQEKSCMFLSIVLCDTLIIIVTPCLEKSFLEECSKRTGIGVPRGNNYASEAKKSLKLQVDKVSIPSIYQS